MQAQSNITEINDIIHTLSVYHGHCQASSGDWLGNPTTTLIYKITNHITPVLQMIESH